MNQPPEPDLQYLRVPPHSIEAEQSVLGGLLLDNYRFCRKSTDVLSEADFYRYDHRLIWQHISRLVNLSRPADVITVNESLSSVGKTEESRGSGIPECFGAQHAISRKHSSLRGNRPRTLDVA